MAKLKPSEILDSFMNYLGDIILGITYDSNTGKLMPNIAVGFKKTKTDRRLALELLNELEKRRILYSPIPNERVDLSIRSVLEVRDYISKEVILYKRSTRLTEYCRELVDACNLFLSSLEKLESGSENMVSLPAKDWREFRSAVHTLRGRFAKFLLLLIEAYEIEIDESVARIIPGVKGHDSRLIHDANHPSWEI